MRVCTCLSARPGGGYRLSDGALAIRFAGYCVLARVLALLGIDTVALAFTHVIQNDLVAQVSLGRGRCQDTQGVFAIPDLLSCLVLSWSEQRARMLQSAAREESWQVEVCDDVQEFLRSVFQLAVPLILVDLPSKTALSYEELREMATQTCGLKRSLFIVCGADEGGDLNQGEEEQWARQLGVWAYLPNAKDRSGLRFVFAEARKALAKHSTVCSETTKC